jgi:hypothetical protein
MNAYYVSVIGWGNLTVFADYFETENNDLRFFKKNENDVNILVAVFPSGRSLISRITYNASTE